MSTLAAGRLRHEVAFQSRERVRANGQWELQWTDVATAVPAEVRPLSGNQQLQSAAIQNSIEAQVKLRWRDDLKPEMRMLHGTDIYDIKQIIPDPTLRRWLTLLVGRPDNG